MTPLPRRRRPRPEAEGPGRPGGSGAGPGNTEAHPEIEGRLDVNTAALTDGSPPAGVDGRRQPQGDRRGLGPRRGPSEVDTEHLPG